MPKLYDDATGALLAEISKADLQVLVEQLEEEDETDVEYFVDAATVDLLESNGASASLVATLRAAVGDDGVDVRWER
jgi:hypothetical protein